MAETEWGLDSLCGLPLAGNAARRGEEAAFCCEMSLCRSSAPEAASAACRSEEKPFLRRKLAANLRRVSRVVNPLPLFA